MTDVTKHGITRTQPDSDGLIILISDQSHPVPSSPIHRPEQKRNNFQEKHSAKRKVDEGRRMMKDVEGK